jgi:hypothetical protein
MDFCSANNKLRCMRFFSRITLAPFNCTYVLARNAHSHALLCLQTHTRLCSVPLCSTVFYSFFAHLCVYTRTHGVKRQRRQGKQQLTNQLSLLSSADKRPTYQIHTLPQVQGRQGEQLQQPHSLSSPPSQHRTKGGRGPRVVVVSNHRLGFWRQQRPTARATATRKWR